ncbi:SusC/RagA family TonB-linked outer membrane protein [Pedobacter hiemivivus]|uniref:SusC/RagA family TonB-linked outer membrane protein n=2 Tax=Pedobacter hiemivivus TaxID=2530454 RepID=A0A4U1GK17_9SPHI|nr:SusC/RagA family TonB-linked outer membrane protein [Pedobacter hiemivivus]
MKICTKNPCWYTYHMKKLLLVMKITTFLLLIAIMQVSASGFAQKITLSQKEITLKEFFRAIKKQTGYNVFYSNQLINDSRKINVDFENEDLEPVLKKVLTAHDLSFNIRDKDISVKPEEKTFLDNLVARFQEIDINGKIVDEKGNALPGTNIKIKGTNRYVISDNNGAFLLKSVDEQAIVVISFVGHRTLEIPANKIKGTITLRAVSANLQEVSVTTAYGIERSKKELGYSVAQVSGEAINKANSGNILNGLIGKVSGLNIMSQSSEMSPKMRVLLRGIRSFGQSSNNQPLFIFNGAPLSFGGDMNAAQRSLEFINNLNPADVEEVTVLKGANATAMYGPEGVNGVIIITTKKVKQGEMSINARVNSSYTRYDYRQRSDQRTFGVGDESGFGVGGAQPGNWGPAYDGKIIRVGFPDKDGNYQEVPYSDLDDRYNFFNVARNTRANVSIAEGNLNSSYYIGAGYNDQTGLLPGDKTRQSTFLYNTNKKVGKLLDLQLNVNYSNTIADRGADVSSKVLNTPSFIPLLSYKDYKNSHWATLDNYWFGINPYAALDMTRSLARANAFTGNFIANFKPLKWLNIKDQISVNYQGTNNKINAQPIMFSDFARVDPVKGLDKDASTIDQFSSATAFNNDLLISTIHKTGDFLIRTNLGNSIRDNFDKALQTSANLVVPVFNNVFARTDQGVAGQEKYTTTRSISAFGNVSLGYKDRVFLELTGRNEWDSKRAKVARGKDLYFGANTSLILKEIVPFLKEQSWIDIFKLRLSAAFTANMNILPQQSEKTFQLLIPFPITNPTTGKSVLGYALTGNPNPLIKPEKVFSQEYGTELAFLENRIKFDAAYYHQINNGVIMTVGIPPYSGYPGTDNAGRFKNTGWEFDLGINPLVDFGKDVDISLTGRFSINNNEVLQVADIYNGTFIMNDPYGNLFYAREGHSAFEYPVTDFKRNPEGKVIVDKNTGLPTVDTQNPKIAGKTLPIYQGGVTLSVRYKRFTLSSQADYSAGNHFQFSSANIQTGVSNLTLINNREIFVFPNSVIEDSPGHFIENKDVPVSNAGKDLFSRFAAASIHTITNASYWRIREVSLQYEMPLKTKWVKKISGSIYANNVFSFYPRSNIYGDPVLSQGPGIPQSRATVVGQNSTSDTNNVSGGSADANAGPGLILYGFTFGLSF